MFLINFPLMLVPFAVYNFFIFQQDQALWDRPTFQLQMLSGSTFILTLGQCLIIVGLLLLFVEVVKAARPSTASIVDHVLSTLVFVAYVVEFLLVGRAGTATFFILMTMTFVDVLAGYSVSFRNSSHGLTLES
jgi:hypothetical protein